ncbi:MAG TPA: tetratricopeptide repeat protein [Gemmatimonadales bacterium]|nr:tetratricopeptide repeat protein [Gemmatimonadales bacterium]
MIGRCLVLLTASVVPIASAQQPRAQPPRLEELEARARQDSLDPEAHFRLAARYYTLKRFADEERELRATIAIDPRYAPAYLWLGYLPFDRRPKLWAEYRKDKIPAELQPAVEESFRLWQQAVLIDPMVDFRVQGTTAPPEDMMVIPEYGGITTDYLLWLGLGAFGVARYELAYSGLDLWAQRTYANEPQDSIPDFLFLYRGLAAGHLKAYNKAIADIQVLYARSLQAERTDSLLPFPLETNDYRYILAVLNQSWGKSADAIRLFEEVLASDLGLYMAHVRMAQIYRAHKMWGQSIAEARRAIETNPNDPTSIRELGVILDEAGQAAEAATTLRQAANANPRDPRTLYHLGVVQHELAQPAEARETLGRFIAIAPVGRYEQELADAKQRLAALPQ